MVLLIMIYHVRPYYIIYIVCHVFSMVVNQMMLHIMIIFLTIFFMLLHANIIAHLHVWMIPRLSVPMEKLSGLKT